MPDFAAIYEKLRQSGMNDWVGGADPQEVGDSCAAVLLRHIPIGPTSNVLDYGAGIGRVALSVLRQRPDVKGLTGIDIVPKMVRFCDEAIGSRFPNTRFELLADHNEHYERFKDKTRPKSREEITREHGETFDAAYAFSVFTHVDTGDFVPLLKFVSSLLKPGGRFLFTAFALTPFARMTLKLGWTFPVFEKTHFEDDGSVFIGNPEDRLAFIAFDISRLEAMILEAGLITCAIEYGNWRGGSVGQSYQDVFVCRKPFDVTAQS